MPELTRRALADAWDAGYEHASKLTTGRSGIRADDCANLDCVFSLCGDPRVKPWTEDHDGFWRIFREYRVGFRDYLLNRGDPWSHLAARINTDDPDWLLGPEPAQ